MSEPMSTDTAMEFVIQAISAKRPEWTLKQIREMVGHAETAISHNPAQFVDIFLDNIRAIEAAHEDVYRRTDR